MSILMRRIDPTSGEKDVADGGLKGRRSSWWRKPIGIILLGSLAVHAMLLVIFGGVVLFSGGVSENSFQSEQRLSEESAEVESPNFEEKVSQETGLGETPLEAPDSAQGPAASEALVKVDRLGWVLVMQPKGGVPVVGWGSQATDRGRSYGELFGIKMGQKKLGAIVDVSGSMRPFLENVLTEVLSNFPDAALVLVDGCGMEVADSNSASPPSPSRSPRKRKKGQERKNTDGPRILPHLVELNRPEGVGSAAVSGWGGLRTAYPRLFEALRNRAHTWIVVGDGAEAGTRLAFEHLAEERVQAIYWFSDFADSVEPREGERAAEIVRRNKIEVYLHPMEGLKNISRWSGQVGAKVVDAKVKESRRP